jgi:NADPH:quinone reductase-like Zn-dependent oxidoreductase
MQTLTSARAFWVSTPGRGEIRDETLPPLGHGELLVRAEFSGISRGTEALVFNGRVPVSERSRMRAPFQSGDFPAPVKYGYASAGVVEDGDPKWHARRVFALYPHQTRYVIPATAVHLLPDDVPSGRAVLAANMETAVNGCWDANAGPADRVTVIGAGAVGCLVAWVMRQTVGCAVELIDTNPRRAAIAAQLDIPFAPAAAAAADRTIIIHTSASEAGLQQGLTLAAPDATIVEMSWFGDRTVMLPLGEAFHSRRLTIRSSQVGSIPPARRGEWDIRRRMAHALDLLRDRRLDALITGESSFDALPEVMARLATDPGDTLCHRIRY